MSPTRAMACVLMVAAVGCAFVGLRPTSADVKPIESSSLETPLWSPRRVPQPIVDAVGGQRLQAALDAAVGGVNACFVVDEGGAPIATRGADQPFVPASTVKLLTSAVALSVLGPDSTLDTRALAAKPVENGVVDRLFLVGGGDPLLMTPDVQALREEIPELRGTPTTSLATLADAIVKAGVKRIPNGIGADDSRYEQLRYIPTWDPDYRTEGQVGPIGALTVNGGFSQLRPEPVPVDDPAIFAAEKLAELLRARGVTIGKSPTREAAPGGAVEIAKVQSPPLTDIIKEELTTSDNLGSEMLTREIGLKVSQQGTTAAGTKAILAKAQALGLPIVNVTMVDGSGLDKGNRSTCGLLVATLGLGARSEFGGLWTGLSVAGQSGTLIDQIGGALTGKVRGKTGTLSGTSGLVGLVEVNRQLRFAFLASGSFTEQGAIELRGRIVEIIATFPDAPPADALVPPPAEGASQAGS
jgi:serine-type D-Ala-D-Ala carboxypeptidase/endopeptidase (penicillin-binding protein 4)